MSNHKDDLLHEANYGIHTGKCTELSDIKWQVDDTMEENNSQNFCLKLSQTSIISETEVTNDDDVIVISDSSSESSCSPKYVSRLKTIVKKFPKKEKTIYINDSTDSEKSENDNYLEAWKENKKSVVNNYQWKNTESENMYTSDESSSSIDFLKNYVASSDKTGSSYISCTTNSAKTNSQSDLNTRNEKYTAPSSVINRKEPKNSNVNIQPTKTISSILKNYNDIKKTLTPKDTRNIMKNIKSKRIVYDSPKVRKTNVESDEEVNDNIRHPAISPRSRPIPETPVDSENEIVPDTQENLGNGETHVSKYFNTPAVEKNVDTVYTKLSERKKEQISQWLMANVSESQDDSFSIVPPSNKDDTTSGNSSLERLERNYETPNNRGRIHQQPVENEIKHPDTNKTPGTVVRQKTINEFVQKTKDNKLILSTSKKTIAKSNVLSTANEQKNVDIMDCAHILDKLYGKSWRDKADVLFPNSEPRKQAVPVKSRAVQTERKQIRRKKSYISDTDDDSDTSLKDLNVQNSPRKQTVQNTVKRKDSFINDESSGSDSESLYYTALTNPRTSASSTQSKSKAPPINNRLFVICDTDTEDENQKNNRDQGSNVRGRKLSFSNDESEDTSTSEFDPGDIVPPKPTSKKGSTKIVRQLPKPTVESKTNVDASKYKKCNSFLASLSENVPIAEAHPDAKKYRLNFKDNKEMLCTYLYKLYNEKVFDKQLPENMTIDWNIRMRGTAGYCYNKKSVRTLGGVVRSSRIVLATKILDTPDRLRDTLIHEMCHAAAWLINGVSDGHGPLWTQWANKAMRTFPEIPPIRRCHDYKIKTKFTYRCVGCGYSIGRHSKSLDVERKRCGHCYGRFELLLNKTTKSGTIQVQTPKREPSKFALFVKENYNSVKKERNMRHGEVMKILGKKCGTLHFSYKRDRHLL
ncbi:acidic repeat-containing protein isoform X2 [Ceratina calcarata]|uniref:Acidic repeat-containing protein isoform X2 n=1 Tax=Ceratina calcarata TaxID=156304 RepID=A0AAJ7W942_9HYME|nr:acidic repeat-containing protein isoform X2 [Ceratina calcarata]